MAECELCLGKLHVPTARGSWAPCVCSRPLLARMNIKPELRGNHDAYPPEYDALDPWPLQDLMVRGDRMRGMQAFQFMAWRSVNVYYHRHEVETYEAMNALRLVDISFQKDKTYDAVSELAHLDLLILFWGLQHIAHKMLPEVTETIIVARQVVGKPTWVYAGLEFPVENVPEWKAGNLGKPPRT